MEKVEIIFKFMRNLAWGLVVEGIGGVLLGILILVYPDLLGLLVGIFLVATGIWAVALGIKVFGYSKLKIEI